jgi:hypothetical protein
MAKSDPPIKAVTEKHFVRFAVAFKSIGVFFPIIAAFMTLLCYSFFPPPLSELEIGGLLILVIGLFSALLIAFVYALCSIPFVALTNRGLQDYIRLERTEEKLRRRLGNPVFRSETSIISDEEITKQTGLLNLKQDSQKLAVYREAYSYCHKLNKNLYSPEAFELFSNMGDVDAWEMANRAQEELIKIEELPGVLEEARQVYVAIQTSSMNNRDELLKELAEAISVLDPPPAEDVHEDNSGRQFNGLRKKIRELRSALGVRTSISNPFFSLTGVGQIRDQENTGNSQLTLEAETHARNTIYSIGSSLHRFQEGRLAGILQARSNLVLATLASGIITYALVCVSIIAIGQTLPDPTKHLDDYTRAVASASSTLASAVVIYTTGVAAGLFGRLYVEANKESAAKDYGLSRARLQAIPLISGLAAIGGVFITTTTLGATNESAVLMSVFALNVRTILVAMIFGFAPNLLIKGFERHSDQYASNLADTKER